MLNWVSQFLACNTLVPLLQVGGHWLSWWMVAAAAVSQIGQFEAEMSSDSFQLLGMSERGFLPKALGRRSKHDTPTVSNRNFRVRLSFQEFPP